MSNLKKILSLVLAVTMILSVAMTSAMAGPFIDVDDDHDYAAAINLLQSLEVLLGFEDGSYQPSGTYTREQFAKILYVLMNGKDDNASMYSGASPFPDVAADRWSAGYITWASNLGVINGREDGLFYPQDVVKYAEAAKMFIVAMGYSSSIYSYPYGFIDKAQTLGMFDDLTGYSTFGDANRGTVAQMGYNVLFAEAPRFGTYTTQEGNSTNTNTYTVIEGAFGVMKASGRYVTSGTSTVWTDYVLVGTSNKAYGAPLYDDNQIAISVGGSEEVYDYLGDVDDYIGEPVQIWYKPPTDKTTFGSDSDLILIERLSGVKVYTVNPMDIDTDRSGAESLYFTDGSVTRRMRLPAVSTVSGTTYYGIQPIAWDGDNGAIFDNVNRDTNAPSTYMTNVDFYPAGGTIQKSAVYKFIDYTGDGILDAAYIDVPDFTKVSSVSSTRLSVTTGALAGSKTLKDDDGYTVINVYDGIAKDDRVLVYRSQAVLGGSVEDTYNVVKAEAVKNVKHNSQTQTKYYFDSVQYKLASSITLKLGDSYDIYLNANGYIAEASKVSGSSSGNWIMLTNSAESKNSVGTLTAASLTGYTADGTKRTYLIDLDEVDEIVYMDATATTSGTKLLDPDNGWSKDSIDGKVAGYGRVFAYTLSNNGEIDSLKHIATVARDSSDDALTDYYYDESITYNDDTNVLRTSGGGRGNVSSDTVLFNIYGSGDIQVLKASDMPEITGTSTTIYDLGVDSGDVIVASIKSGSKLGTSSNKYGLIISAMEYAGSGSKFYYDLTVAVDGEIKTLRTKEVSGGADSSNITHANLISSNAVGYAKIELNTSGEVNKLTFLDYTASPGENDASWVHGAVNTKSSSGKGLGLLEFTSYKYNGTNYQVTLGSNQDFVLDSDCKFYLVDVNPYVSFNVTANENVTWDESNLDPIYNNGPKVINFSNDSKKVSPATVDSMTMTDANNGWMIDLIIEDDKNEETVVAVFIYVNPVRR